jgi:hypothetical protein
MDDQRINDKLDKIIEDISDIKVESGKMRADWEYHVKRTDIAERHISLLEKAQQENFNKIQADLEPLKSFRDRMLGALKLGTVILTTAGTVIAIIRFIVH